MSLSPEALNSTYGRALTITVVRLMEHWPGPEPITVHNMARVLSERTGAKRKALRHRLSDCMRELQRAGMVTRTQHANEHKIPYYIYTLTPRDHVRPAEHHGHVAPGKAGQPDQAGAAQVHGAAGAAAGHGERGRP